MGANQLETVGDQASIGYSGIGTLTLGTLTGGTVTAGILDGDILATGTFSLLSGIYDITPNAIVVRQVETTHLDSDADRSQPGTPNYGEVSAELKYTAATTSLINAMVDSKSVQFWQLTVDDFASTDSAEAFLAYVANWTPLGQSAKKDEVLKGKLTLKITGKAKFAAGS